MQKPLENRSVTALGFEVADEIERRVDEACAHFPEKKDALMDYSLAYADAFLESRGKLPSVQALTSMAELDAEAIQQEMAELPENIESKTLTKVRNMPMSRAPHLEKIFGEGNDRLYFEFEVEDSPFMTRTSRKVTKALAEHGYETNMEERTATNDGGKNNTKVGKLLRRLGEDDLLRDWSKATGGLQKDGMVVLSRNPHDIARASTARRWTSCIDERSEGGYADKLIPIAEEGSMIAYLTTKSDPDLHNPMSRILLKPFMNHEGHVAMLADKDYGISDMHFCKAMDAFCAEYNAGLIGSFKKVNNIQTDGISGFRLDEEGNLSATTGEKTKLIPSYIRHGACTAEEFLDFFQMPYTEHEDGTIHVPDVIDLKGQQIMQLPDIRYVRNKGLNLSETQLTTLKGCPEIVEGSFDCSCTPLESLEGGPQVVKGAYYAGKTNIRDLKGVAQDITGCLDFDTSQLESLEGAQPEQVIYFYDTPMAQDYPDGSVQVSEWLKDQEQAIERQLVLFAQFKN